MQNVEGFYSLCHYFLRQFPNFEGSHEWVLNW